MRRYLLDTNIAGNYLALRPSAVISQWLHDQRQGDLFISAITVAEIERGIVTMQKQKERERLQALFSGSKGMLRLFRGRILPLDSGCGLCLGRVMAARKGRVRILAGDRLDRRDVKTATMMRLMADAAIAAIAIANGAVVVTANEKDFRGVCDFVNPAKNPP